MTGVGQNMTTVRRVKGVHLDDVYLLIFLLKTMNLSCPSQNSPDNCIRAISIFIKTVLCNRMPDYLSFVEVNDIFSNICS